MFVLKQERTAKLTLCVGLIC